MRITQWISSLSDQHPDIPTHYIGNDSGTWRIQRTPIGTFILPWPTIQPPQDYPVSTEPMVAHFTLSIPKMPRHLLLQITQDFQQALPHECLINVVWDSAYHGHRLDKPPQDTSPSTVFIPDPGDPYDARRPRVLQIHSHGVFPAFFSDTDDADEQATGFYAVMGLLNTPQPVTRLRLSVAGRFWTLPLSAIFQDHDGA